MKVGWKYVLHSVAFPWLERGKQDEIIIVTVTEVRKDVKDMWTGEKKHTGLKAVDANGVEYTCCWDSFPSDSMTPMWQWFCPSTKDFWFDLAFVTQQGRHPTAIPEVVRNLDFFRFCDVHREFHYVREGDGIAGCWQCHLEQQYPKRRREREEKEAAGKSIWGHWTGGV